MGSADLRVGAETAERSQQIWVILQGFRAFTKWVLTGHSAEWAGLQILAGHSADWARP